NDSATLSQAPPQLRLMPRNGLQNNIVQQPGATPTPADWRIYAAIPEGEYYLDSPLAVLREVYISDIRQADRSIYDTGTIVVGENSAEPVAVVLARPAGQINGTVQAADGKPFLAGSHVVLIPDGSRRTNRLLYKRATTGDNGQFTLVA